MTVLAGVLLGLSGGVAAGLVAPAPAAAETVRQSQWWLDTIHVIKAQQVTQGEGVTVAVIDSGVDSTHPDLAGALVAGTGMLGSTSAKGWDDPQGHGTGIASVIAGRGGGPTHMLGIAPKAKILPIALPVPFSGSISGPIHYAVDHGAKIINMSFGGRGSLNQDEIDAVAWARSKGAILVAAGGNKPQGDDHVPTPGSYPGVITVNGTDRDGNLWDGALDDDTMDIAAPAQDMIAAQPKTISPSGYGIGSGTSASTAVVSGVLALIWSKYPKLDAANVINRLFKTAVDKGPPGRDDRFGNGLLDAYAAVNTTVQPVSADPLGPIAAGTPSAGPGSDSTSGSTSGSGDDGFGTPATRAAIVAGVGLAAIALLVLAIVLPVRAMNRRRDRRAAAAGGGQGPPFGPPGGFPPPGQPPPGFPPPGYPAPGQAPPGYPPTGPASGYPPGQAPAGFPSSGYPPASQGPSSGYPPGGQASGQTPSSGYPPGGQASGYPPGGQASGQAPSSGYPSAGYPGVSGTGQQPAVGHPHTGAVGSPSTSPTGFPYTGTHANPSPPAGYPPSTTAFPPTGRQPGDGHPPGS